MGAASSTHSRRGQRHDARRAALDAALWRCGRCPELLRRVRSRLLPPLADAKKVARLVRLGKLAPREPSESDAAVGDFEVDECPICCCAYPALNRAVCCRASLCTDCFVHLQCRAAPPPGAAGAARCPFCGARALAVKFAGRRPAEEREREWRAAQLEREAQRRERSGGSGSGSSGEDSGGGDGAARSHDLNQQQQHQQQGGDGEEGSEDAARAPVAGCIRFAAGAGGAAALARHVPADVLALHASASVGELNALMLARALEASAREAGTQAEAEAEAACFNNNDPFQQQQQDELEPTAPIERGSSSSPDSPSSSTIDSASVNNNTSSGDEQPTTVVPLSRVLAAAFAHRAPAYRPPRSRLDAVYCLACVAAAAGAAATADAQAAADSGAGAAAAAATTAAPAEPAAEAPVAYLLGGPPRGAARAPPALPRPGLLVNPDGSLAVLLPPPAAAPLDDGADDAGGDGEDARLRRALAAADAQFAARVSAAASAGGAAGAAPPPVAPADGGAAAPEAALAAAEGDGDGGLEARLREADARFARAAYGGA